MKAGWIASLVLLCLLVVAVGAIAGLIQENQKLVGISIASQKLTEESLVYSGKLIIIAEKLKQQVEMCQMGTVKL